MFMNYFPKKLIILYLNQWLYYFLKKIVRHLNFLLIYPNVMNLKIKECQFFLNLDLPYKHH